jgi:CRISPR-associated protein Csh2
MKRRKIKMSEVKNRGEILFLYDLKDANPNGDPLDSNKPRIDEETSINIVTDVRLKRTIRDYLFEYKEQEIFVREKADKKGKIQDGKQRGQDFGKKKEEIMENVLEQCIDVRLFGATIPMDKDSVTFTGPVQFSMGRSLHKVELKYMKGTGAFASGEGKKNKTFREEYVLPYSLIGFYGIVNENAAKHTGLKEKDVTLLLDGMWNGTKNLISRSKIGQVPRLLMKINYKEKNYHIGDLLRGIKLVTSLNAEEAIRGIEDYHLDVTEIVGILNKNIDIIESIEFKVDERINFTFKEKTMEFIEIFKKFKMEEIKL